MIKKITHKMYQLSSAIIAGVLISVCITQVAHSQQKHALLIGIDKYVYDEDVTVARLGNQAVQPRRWTDLRGAVNDANNMKELLVSRFAFDRDNIHTLFDEDATRENILAAIEQYIVNTPNPGDEVFFYYAGHGSQVPNSLSDEVNKMDETLVPTDAFFGAQDIRDKELRALFNKALDRNVRLTMIFDSCHSGSITRGVPSGVAERKIEPGIVDVADGSLNNLPSPEERGALVLSSARDEQTAKERFNPQTQNVTGIFTDTLTKLLREAQPNEPISIIMNRVQTIVRASIADQDPVLAGIDDRINAPLFGDAGDVDNTLYAGVLQKTGNIVVLQGGRAIGLNVGAVLQHHTAGENPAMIEVTQLEQLTQAISKVTSGDASKVEVGDLFKVISFGINEAQTFTVYIPEALETAKEVMEMAQSAYQLASARNARWVSNPSAEAESFDFVNYTGGSWVREAFGIDPVQGSLSEIASAGSEATAPVFVNIPPTNEMRANFDFVKFDKSIIRLADERSQADYMLVGAYQPNENQVSYHWVRPNMTTLDNNRSIFPVTTDPVRLTAQNPQTELNRQINAISRIKGWMDLDAPPASKFPFTLGFQDVNTGEIVEADHLDVGDYELVLINTKGAHPREFDSHHVYVFFADNTGRIGLLYPNTSSSSVFPTAEWINRDEGLPEVHSLMSIPILEPFAVNSVFMLTSKTPIGNPRAIFNQEPVVGDRSGTRAVGTTPLESLIQDRNTATRTFGSPPVIDWSLTRLFVTTGQKK